MRSWLALILCNQNKIFFFFFFFLIFAPDLRKTMHVSQFSQNRFNQTDPRFLRLNRWFAVFNAFY
jgi:hypothetical protein